MRLEGTKSQISQRLHQHYQENFKGDGVTLNFFLVHTIVRLADLTVTVDGVRQRVSDRGVANDFAVRGHTPGFNGDRNAIRFTVAPLAGVDIAANIVST